MAVKHQPETLADKLQAIIDAAPALRRVGVTEVGGELPFKLSPADPEPVRGGDKGKTEQPDPEIDDLAAFRHRMPVGGS